MATHIGIGFSHNLNIEKAAKDAAFESKTNLRYDRIDLAVVFSTLHYDPQRTIPVLNKILNNVKMVGTSTAGVILSHSIHTRGIGVLTIASDEMKIGIGSIDNVAAQDARQTGINLAKNSIDDLGQLARQAFIFLCDGHLNHTPLLVRGMQDVLGNAFSIIGAGNSGDFQYDKTFQILRNKVVHRSAFGLLIGGQINVAMAARHGWRPLGKPRTINKAQGHILKTINDQKAISLYEDYFKEGGKTLPLNELTDIAKRYPLGIALKENREYLIRNAVDFLPDGSIVCQGNVPQGAQVHIMIGNKDSCHQAALETARKVQQGLQGKKAKLVIILESMSRLRLLRRDAPREIKKVKNVFGPDVPIFGMYTNGEVYPSETSEMFKKLNHQSHSIMIVAIG